MLLKVERAKAGGKKLADKPGFGRRKLGGGRIGQRELQAAGATRESWPSWWAAQGHLFSGRETATGQKREAPVAPSRHSVIDYEQLWKHGPWCLRH